MPDAAAVHEILQDVLFHDDEIEGRTPPDDAVIVEGIINPFAFHPGRLEKRRADIEAQLSTLPANFKQSSGGGGWSFLAACQDENDEQWTGEHRTMDWLFCLGQAIGLVDYLLPRDMWEVLPGGMPYLVVKL